MFFIGMSLAKLMSAFVFVYTLYFLSYAENRKFAVERFFNLSNLKRVPLTIFAVIAFCIFVGNFL